MYICNPVHILVSLWQKFWLVSPTMYWLLFLQYIQYEPNVDMIGGNVEDPTSRSMHWQAAFSLQCMLFNKVLLKSFCDSQLRQDLPKCVSSSTPLFDSYTLKKPFSLPLFIDFLHRMLESFLSEICCMLVLSHRHKHIDSWPPKKMFDVV